MRLCTRSFLTALAALAASPASAEKVVKESIRSQGKERTYYLFVPDTVSPETPAPVLVLLHGSGRNGLSLVEKWKSLAKKEGIILAGPDALNPREWIIPDDGPGLVHELVESLRRR